MLVIRDFCVSYQERAIIKDLNINVDFPSIVAVIGNNGAGKSSFLNALRGQITFSGTVENKASVKELEYAFLGSAYRFNFPILVEDFIKVGADDFDKEKFLFLITALSISDLLEKGILEISQGQLQKCLIAQTLLQNKEIILLDEPEAHLDIKNRNVLSQTLLDYALKFNKIIFMVSHDLKMVGETADFIINFSRESIELEFNTPEILEENIRQLSL